MPIPREDENEAEFVARCMGDEEAISDFPENEQRLAFCYAVYARSTEEERVVPMEKKMMNFASCEVKMGDFGIFEGYASVFDGIDSYNDSIVKGAYTDTLANRDRPVAMYFNHNSFRSDMPATIGKWMSMEEDAKGLYVKGQLSLGHPTADAIYASMRNETIDGLSIGFKMPQGGYDMRDGIRYLRKIDLVEVSVVDNPADNYARISLDSVKSDIEGIKSIREAEEFLRDAANLSNSSAKALLAQIKSVLRDEVKTELEQAMILNRLNQIIKGN
jgi:HK97 family phage prohead protease